MPAVESEAKAKTKVRFEEIFRNHADLIEKKKIKKKQFPENIVLETFKNHLTKGSENEPIINNTYNPDESSPRIPKCTLRDKASIEEKTNDVVSRGESKQIGLKKKKKAALQKQLNEEEKVSETKLDSSEKQIQVFTKKKTDRVLQADAAHWKGDINMKGALSGLRDRSELDEEEEQLIQAYEQQVAEEEASAIKKKIKKKLQEQMSEFIPSIQSHETVLNNEVRKKKKKKKEVLVPSESQTSAMSLSELQHEPEEENTRKKRSLERPFVSKSKEGDLLIEQETKGKKAKRKSPKALEEDTENMTENTLHMTSGNLSPESKPDFDDNLVLGVYIHRTDRLKTDFMVSHPMVKVHVVDEKTGLYVKKENSSRQVSSFYEQEKVGHILPIMTQPYDFRRFKSTLPEWEEQILFNERFNYFLQDAEGSPRVILFFEILDFLSMNDAKANFDIQAQESGFRKISWAFLKLVGANGVLNVGGKVRLQLYSPPPRTRSQLHVVEVYDWWAKCPRNNYPSTLYVTVKGIKLPDHVNPSLRSMMAIQQEYHSTSFLDLQNDTSKTILNSGTQVKKEEPFKWSKLPGQVCRLPNKYLFSLKAGDMGCFCIRFSEDGRTLAAGCAGRDGYPVVLYEIPSGCYLREFYGHLNIVYDLCWSKDNQHLLTASSDGTARMWKIEAQATSATKVFPHPSFVYAAKFHPVAEYLVVTGCYDSVIRVWNAKVKEIHGQLLQEFDGHKSFINTLCFNAEGFHMFSGDGTGLIIIWNTFVKENSQSPVQHWGIDKEINDGDIKGTAINYLEVHPNGRRLLIHTKDSTVRIMDLRILATKKYIGATNYREKIQSTLTPCGTFLFSGSEDGVAYVWNLETGDQVAMYSDLSFTSPLRDVAFHPLEHMVAFCAFGQNQPILVYIYDYKVAKQGVEAVKELSGSQLIKSPRSPQTLSMSATVPAQKNLMISSADQFANVARISIRMQKVKQKLDSVTASSSPMLPSQSLLPPHSRLRLTNNPGSFIPIGNAFSQTPSAGLHLNTNFTASSYARGDANSISVHETVVALYDYTAHRSDELTIHCNDIIQVLYKDNDNWWFGSLANGQQGYFPANYVVGETQYEQQQSKVLAEESTLPSNEFIKVTSPAVPEILEDTSKLGDQRFISVNDTDYLTEQITSGQTPKGMDTEELEYKANDCISFNDVEDEPKKNRKKRKKGMVKTTNRKGTSDDGFQLNYPEA
ncbi:jouberin isoform X1 [Pseudonaja textilis]|uniref:Jouberin n=1 Tax=Pseudonaja textilis TaxID=8673 RepID=A0A670YX76_PSETE|nr:jouberin isoform X1 [Pseudonaja textilis]XP_026561322.1 jouberin isoform X1 [Pseudonaja textilis]XP_026561323.1 jouberin isoform X1 [Pseudonaja textilis]XP_026561324.1 jouberin isoform X1 [Pseudonaja textilis]XP_026561325.1 jouberin isoform X1 [Pseudonaja textilis]